MQAGRPARSDTRAQILTIARRLFVDQGYAGTSIVDLARELGTTTAALYYHFPSKADILAELLAGPLEAFTRVAEHAAGLRPETVLGELLDLTIEWRDLIRLVTEEPAVHIALGGDAQLRSHQLIAPIVAALAGKRPTRAARIRAWAAFTVVRDGTLAALRDTDQPVLPADRDEILAAAVRALFNTSPRRAYGLRTSV
jgi:AcrR family transcriptional regulator